MTLAARSRRSMPISNSRAPTLQLHSPATGGSISPARLAEGSRALLQRRSTVSARAPPPVGPNPAPSCRWPRPLPRALWACKEVPARPLHSRARIRAPPEAGLRSRRPFCSSRGSSGERRRKPGAGRLGGGPAAAAAATAAATTARGARGVKKEDE